ncbi:MAG TPA: prolyl oligopeptidase family serine peptidase [Rhizomicrobium sp.]|nr:prolyl oligopeptidase family serine peptidase [Rhizomicrobium sp.]
MKPALVIGAATFAAAFSAAAAGLTQPPPLPAKPVTETYFGQKVTDDYRFMENLGPETTDWMKAQGAYTHGLLDSIPGRAALGKRVGDFTGSFDAIEGYATYGGRDFYEERQPGADNFDVMVRDAKGTRKIVDIEAVMKAHGGKPYAVNYFLPSPDGSEVAVGMSEGGSENADLYVYDASSGKEIAGPIPRVQFGATGWSDDSKILFFNQLKKLGPKDPATDKYRYTKAYAWNLKTAPVAVAGPEISKNASFTPDEVPVVAKLPGTPEAVLLSINGVQPEWKGWTAPAADATDPAAPWKLAFDRGDDVTNMDGRGSDIFLLSHKDAPTYKVLELAAGDPISKAHVIVPAEPDRVIEGVHAAKDGLYVLALRGAYSELLRVPSGSTKIETIKLPTKGHIAEAFSDPRTDGIEIYLSSWVLAPTEYAYDPSTGKFTDLKLGKHGNIDPADYTVSDLQAKSYDGAMVPLSLIQPKNSPTPQVTVIEAYGSYGITNLADFSPRRAAMMKEGINYAICHVRGSAMKGHSWYLAGKDANKHNTWLDLVACSKDLIARHVATAKTLFILGGSAGGITMGRAMETAPDLYAGVIDIVPAANTLRSEFSPNGPDNIPEFGTVKTEQGFKNLYDMDSIVHLKRGADYPAILISTGLNDPRVSPWEPAKFANAMMALHGPNPVLLRVDSQAGHGIGSTRSQTDALTSDWIAFVKWRAGVSGWKPEDKAH